VGKYLWPICDLNKYEYQLDHNITNTEKLKLLKGLPFYDWSVDVNIEAYPSHHLASIRGLKDVSFIHLSG
jgi:hypothetical protein